jgi:hypothetical protein
MGTKAQRGGRHSQNRVAQFGLAKPQRIEAPFILFIPSICIMEISTNLTTLERRKKHLDVKRVH